MAPQNPFRIRQSAMNFTRLMDWSDFPMVPAYMVYIPGMPTEGRVMTFAESMGVKLPTYPLSDISKLFFQQTAVMLARNLSKIEPWPREDDELWFPAPGSRGLSARQEVWTLADVERMIHLLHREGIILIDRLIVSWQILMWVAKGHGFYA